MRLPTGCVSAARQRVSPRWRLAALTVVLAAAWPALLLVAAPAL
ncbi:hypothetical protein [Nocardia terpenica]|nr:hypothetical protein [Nocardia terpenica]